MAAHGRDVHTLDGDNNRIRAFHLRPYICGVWHGLLKAAMQALVHCGQQHLRLELAGGERAAGISEAPARNRVARYRAASGS